MRSALRKGLASLACAAAAHSPASALPQQEHLPAPSRRSPLSAGRGR